MQPGPQFDRPSLDTAFRTPHSQQRENERDVPHDILQRVLNEGVQLPNPTHSDRVIYAWQHPDTGDRYKVSFDPSSKGLPTVMHSPGDTPEERAAMEQRTHEQNRAAAQSQRQTSSNRAAQEEKQARRDWGQNLSHLGEFPGMAGYKAAKAAAKKK